MMMDERDREEYERRKRAIFEGMSERGQRRILRMGYDEWDPFLEPKDPREMIKTSSAVRAAMMVSEFYETGCDDDRYRDHKKELMDLCRGLLRREPRARAVMAFCKWFAVRGDQDDVLT